jgi:TolA-binding protein
MWKWILVLGAAGLLSSGCDVTNSKQLGQVQQQNQQLQNQISSLQQQNKNLENQNVNLKSVNKTVLDNSAALQNCLDQAKAKDWIVSVYESDKTECYQKFPQINNIVIQP